ncbi:hypothetical protein TrVFT333_009665 [Trichoderma virens FT-333]|nr:hypothetical protein TrVFT333_009665 [Trichoderma virens FT-333]
MDYWFNLGRIWIQSLLDVYHLNCDSMTCWEGDDLQIVMEFFDEGYYRLDVMPLSLRAEYFSPLNLETPHELDDVPEYAHFDIQERQHNQPNPDDPYHEFATSSERPFTRVSLSATMMFICVHAKREHAAESGLFGILLDAPVQLVGFDDEDRLRKFHALFEKGCSNHKRPELSKQFASVFAPDFRCQVQSWREKVDWLMMANAWLRAKYNYHNCIPIDGDPGLVWNPPLSDDRTRIYINSC